MTASRAYLDWNASAPLRPEARAAMGAAMDEVGNPSSVHAEGRRAKAIVERARAQVADLVGCAPMDVVFTSGATEAARVLATRPAGSDVYVEPTAHDCLWTHLEIASPDRRVSPTHTLAHGLANGETGMIAWPARDEDGWICGAGRCGALLLDPVQMIGKAAFDFAASGATMAIASAHKIGGPKGVGALILRRGLDISPLAVGGGQEESRRAGTENVIGIAGFGAAAEAAKRDLAAGAWERVEALRNSLETRLEDAAPDIIIFGRDAERLANTSCFAVPGWAGETQVMRMDLAGFAVSAGSACSSGKVEKASRVLLAMGFDELTASSAIRVSIGPTTTEAEVMAFADAWEAAHRRWRARAA